MHRTIAELGGAVFADPNGRVLHPVHVVTIFKIFTCMRAAGFLTRGGAVDGGECLIEKIIKFQRFDEVGIPDQRTILNAEMGGVSAKPRGSSSDLRPARCRCGTPRSRSA